jgi:hypothetical protein
MKKTNVARNNPVTNLIEKLIFSSSDKKFLVLLVASIIIRSGIWYVPHFGAITQMAANPFVNPFPDANGQYNFYNWLGPFIAWFLQIRTFDAYFAYNLLISLAFAFVAIRWIMSLAPGKAGRIGALVFSALPVSTLPFFWVGYDGLTLLLITCIMAFWKKTPIVFCLGVLSGMQHFEQTFMAFSCIAFASVVFRKSNVFRIKSAFFVLLGIVLGRLILSVIFQINDIELNSGRAWYLRTHLRTILTEFFYHPQIFLYSALGLAWIPLIYIFRESSKSRPYWVPLALILCIAPISGDGTRVLAIVTLPIALIIITRNFSILEQLSQRTVAFMFLILLITPFTFAWAGHPKWSALPFNVIWILNKVFGWPEIPEDLAFWVINS